MLCLSGFELYSRRVPLTLPCFKTWPLIFHFFFVILVCDISL